jgi:tetratricopeptide (TPR) repeat protein
MNDPSGLAGPSGPAGPGRRRTGSLIWGSEIPFRNPDFVGREEQLIALKEQLETGGPAVITQPSNPVTKHPPGTLFGLGGVGKTEIATEYAHRYQHEYDVVWWVRAEQEDSIRASLVALGRRLRLPDAVESQRDREYRAVIEALAARDPYERWLLIFDNVTQPGMIGRYLPPGGGHVIITSRLTDWRQELRTAGIEVREFPLADSVAFLRKRVRRLYRELDPDTMECDTPEREEEKRQRDAERLAATLGNLPLAVDHAASFLAQTGTLVSEYIEAFERNAHELFSSDADLYSADNMTVATTWSVTRNSLSAEARELFELLSFFSAEPISDEILIRPVIARSLSAGLQRVLSDRSALKRAERELARFSLISMDGVRNVVQLHRVVQAVTKGRIEIDSEEAADTLRATVHALLASSDPGSPEKEQNDPIFERSIHHLVPSGALESDNPALRSLIIHQVTRLYLRGGYQESLNLGEHTLKIWRDRHPADDRQTLALATQVAVAMRDEGRVSDAFELNRSTLQSLREHYSELDEEYLICANSHGQDLRLLGRYDDALAHDLELLPAFQEVYSPSQHRVLNLRNNIAIDLRCVGRYEEALRYDTENVEERRRYFGATDWQTMYSMFGMARDLRRLGRYDEALATAQELARIMEERRDPWLFFRLDIYAGLSVALRRSGFYAQARTMAEDVYRRYLALVGDQHRSALFTATNLICDRRVTDDLVAAQELGEHTLLSWEKVAGSDHPNTRATRANLAVVLRLRGHSEAAREMDERALAGFRGCYQYDHPSTLVVSTNLASDLAAVGEIHLARELGERTLAASRVVRGLDHPATLAVAANLAIDLRDADEAAALTLREQTLAAYDDRLTLEHPQALRASQRGRVNVDIEPMVP